MARCSHPPTYYLPPADVDQSLLSKTARSSFCEVSRRGLTVTLPCVSIPSPIYIFPTNLSAISTSPLKHLRSSQWKGVAAYFNFTAPESRTTISNRIWSYPSPTKGTKFAPIAGYFSFYASANASGGEGWKCFVEGEEVVPQEGDFYGGWRTEEITGKMKGGAGTWGW